MDKLDEALTRTIPPDVTDDVKENFTLYHVIRDDDVTFDKHFYMTSIQTQGTDNSEKRVIKLFADRLNKDRVMVKPLKCWTYAPNGILLKNVLRSTKSLRTISQKKNRPQHIPLDIYGSDITIIKHGYTADDLIADIQHIYDTRLKDE